MNIDLSSFAFGSTLNEGAGTCSWGTSLGQSRPDYKLTYEGCVPIIMGMIYRSEPKHFFSMPLGKGGKIVRGNEDDTIQLTSIFYNVYVNDTRIDYPFLMAIIREESDSHYGRRSLKYSEKMEYDDENHKYSNAEFRTKVQEKFGLTDNACWFVYAIEVEDFDKLILKAVIVDKDKTIEYDNSSKRKAHWQSLIPSDNENPIIGKSSTRLVSLKDQPLQQIFYGAPGTGKSFKIQEITANMDVDNVFRTTFHPDSDYSTFVGCYKPVKQKPKTTSQTIVDYSTLVDILRQRINTPAANITKECVTFGYEYHDSIVKMQEEFSHTIPSLIVDAYKSGSTYDTQVRAGMAVFESFPTSTYSADAITYSFVPQTFLKAYIRAYETADPVLLTIEEINRGNCAQIFGDLFQLLDRNQVGFSEYPIKADEDLCYYLKNLLGDDSPAIANDELRLPPNLYIWATMNTSDQSLFPIDSAFKRRWDWKYVPIAKKDENYKIRVKGKDGMFDYDWWDFLEKVNSAIGELTSSEDKKLGYFFCKADKEKIISTDKFVSKVLFYLYNDVFKDYDSDDVTFTFNDVSYSLLKYKDGDKERHFKFPEFFDERGDGRDDMVGKFLDNIEVGRTLVEKNNNEGD